METSGSHTANIRSPPEGSNESAGGLLPTSSLLERLEEVCCSQERPGTTDEDSGPGAAGKEDVRQGLPDPPRRPLDSDCCGSGCVPCVFDLYERDLAAWRRQCRDRQPVNPSCPLSPDRYTALTLVNTTQLSDTAAVYSFQLPSPLHLRPGQHLLLQASEAAGRPLTRPYTPLPPDPARPDRLQFYIRRYPAGAMSRCVSRWRVGDEALWRGPFGSYTERTEYARLVMLAAGTGVAPMLQILRNVLDREEEETRLVLYLSVRRLQDVFPRDQLLEYTGFWNFSAKLFVTGGDTSTEMYGEQVQRRRIQRDDLRDLVSGSGLPTRYLVCGPPGFNKDMVQHLSALGVPEADMFRF